MLIKFGTTSAPNCGTIYEIGRIVEMREILFKGKRKADGEWIFGNLLRTDDGIFIIQNHVPYHRLEKYEVLEETVCQYTGLTDKNGRKIFEGDIVKDILNPIVGIVRYGRYRNTLNEDGYGGHVGFYVEWKEKRYLLRKDLVYWINESEFIGNIFDNPELIGGHP